MKKGQDTKNTKKRAAALKYDPETDALPVMTAYGEGYVAEKIIEKGERRIARHNQAEIVTRCRAEHRDEIPPSLYGGCKNPGFVGESTAEIRR